MNDVAIVLAGGRGSRMNSPIAKQFMELGGKPIICYSLEAFEHSNVSKVILVTSEDSISYCRDEIVNKYGYAKVADIVCGGAERYDSVYNGLAAAEDADYVYIHDGARPFVSVELINSMIDAVRTDNALVAAVPCKDTIKISDDNGYVADTPNRSSLWSVQTPQAFSYEIIVNAYKTMMQTNHEGVTDDAMVLEKYGNHKVKLFMGEYTNIKITTPEDLIIGDNFIKNQ